MSPHVPQKVPEHFSRVDIGAYMRELRQHYGLSEVDVSERLHIRVRYVTAIENANFEAMPGKAYARGYVHTYAEFLGLDADQVVERCFGSELAHEVQEHSIPDSASWYKRNKAYGGVLAVLLLLGGLFYFATQTDDSSEGETAQLSEGVESVPEEYLSSMRTRLMPTAQNFDCLGSEKPLGCYFNQRLTQEWVKRAAIPVMSPAPAEAFDEVLEDDDDEDKEEVDEIAEKEEQPKPVAPPLPAPPAKKPEAKNVAPKKAEAKKAEPKKKAAENEKFPGMPVGYKGYYVPPKPEPKPIEEAPVPKTDEAKKAEPKTDEAKKPEPKSGEGEE